MNYVSIIEHVLLMLQRFLQWWIHQGLQDRFKKTFLNGCLSENYHSASSDILENRGHHNILHLIYYPLIFV